MQNISVNNRIRHFINSLGLSRVFKYFAMRSYLTPTYVNFIQFVKALFGNAVSVVRKSVFTKSAIGEIIWLFGNIFNIYMFWEYNIKKLCFWGGLMMKHIVTFYKS